ncbi:ABC transporter permease subunit [Paracoccus marcusii]|uniref:ABC transporter permease subunit n=1 Tax=Paracoccus marcusii TaxID=59779 RepID=UPI002ED5A84F|nr:ABC transporter permease subunit [Paracoccus marcusii]
MARLYRPAPVRFVTRLYIDIFRSIPLLVLLIIVYYALPFVGLRLSPFASAMSALTLVSAPIRPRSFARASRQSPRASSRPPPPWV